MKIRTKFIFSVFSLVIATVVGGGVLQIIAEKNLLQQEMKEHHEQILRGLTHICEESMKEANSLLVFDYLTKLSAERGFHSAFFSNNNGVIQIHSDPNKIGQAATLPVPEIRNYEAPVNYASSRVGTVHLQFKDSVLRNHIRQSIRRTFTRMGSIALISLLFGLLGAIFLARSFVRPIHGIVGGMTRISKGELTPVRLPHRKDELGLLADQLNITIDKLKELEEMKRDFAAKVTHDLKSPLKATLGFLDILLNESSEYSESQKRGFMATMRNESNRLLSLIDNLLLTARIDAQQEKFSPQLFDIRKSLQHVENLYFPISKEKQVDLKVDHPETPVYAYADSDKVLHILDNLLSNAFKFTPSGDVRITVRADESFVTIGVLDSGTGIPKKEQKMVFDKFYRSKSLPNHIKGTGLGLTIVKGLVEGQNGKIWIDDNNGKGTAFWFTLPKAEA